MGAPETESEAALIARWCAGIPELRRIGPNVWQAESLSAVSYPESGHSLLADVESRSYWFAHRNNVIAAMIRNHPPAGPIMDIGGGNGFVSLGLAHAGFASAVIEPGDGGVAVAHERGLPVIQAAFQDLTVPPDSIAAAGLFDVLEHIEDDRAALAGLYRAIAPGGMLYIAVPAHQLLWSEEDVFAGHFRRYTLGSLTRRVRKAGFKPVFASYFFTALPLAIFLQRTLPYALGLHKARPAKEGAQDHTLPGGLVGRALSWTFGRELRQIEHRRRIAFGASCLLACRKA